MASLRMLPILLVLWAFAEAIPVQDRLVDVLSQAVEAAKPLADNETNDDYRLPTHTKPIKYEIKLNPHFEEKNFTVEGESSIELEVFGATQDLKFHVGADLKILTCELYSVDSNGKKTAVNITRQRYFEVTEIYAIDLKESAKPGKYLLKLTYDGVLNGHMRGFYRSNYTDDKGNLRWLATTHFEPVGARLAFPCWDEPDFKAVFVLSLKHTPDYVAISNMPGKTGDLDKSDNKTWTTFEKTPKMSTYLVAFVVSDYGSKVHKEDKNFAVWTKKHVLDQVDYALQVGKEELTRLDNFTNFPYKSMGTPKMDSISIPHFSPGAMENWGLVTYRESALLYQENVTTTSSKQGIASVISHEFAHQWFGNLVSPKWWTYIWLNEGFATYFQYYITDEVEDNWRMMEQFVVNVLQQRAFVADSKEDTRPMNHEVQTPKEISSLFDSISYQKAGSVIRMMSHILTEDVFKAGLRSYLVAKKFDTATSDDLFQHLQAEADKSKKFPKDFSVKKIMDTWVTQKGYPVINVTRDYENDTATVTQERFVLNTTHVEGDIKWWVPINYVMEEEANFNETTPTAWLKPTDESLEIKLENGTNQWVIFNKQQTGYYRVNYDLKNWELITKQLNSTNYTQIHVLNRAQLLDDALNLARSGRLPYSVALGLTTYLDKELDYIPWLSAYSGLSFVDELLKYSTHYEKFQIYMQRQTTNVMKHLGYEGNVNHTLKLHRAQTVGWACYYGLKTCQEFAAQELDHWLNDGKVASTDLKSTVLCTALRTADNATWHKVYDKFTKTKDVEEKELLLSSLACSSNEDILNAYLTSAVKDKTLFEKPEQVIYAVNKNSHIGVSTVLKFLNENIPTVKNITDGTDIFKTLLMNIGKKVTVLDHLYELTTFIVKMEQPIADTHDGFDTALKNLKLIGALQPQVISWLDENNFSLPADLPDGASSLAAATFLGVVAFLLTRIY